MAQLIVHDYESDRILGTREMPADERYSLYTAYGTGALFTFQGLRYRLHGVKWRMPQAECVVRVTFDSYEPAMYTGGT